MTKTLKPVLAMSVAALTLLAGCAKGDANTAWSKTKAELKKTYNIKSFDKCDYVHFDAKKADKKDASNAVALSFTFTLKDGKEVASASYYVVKDKDLSVGLAAAALYATYAVAAKAETAGYTAGTLVK